jgi:hypothetical protein
MKSGYRKAREWKRVWHHHPERGMHGGAPQDSEGTP